MLGAVLLVIALLVIPITIVMSGVLAAAAIGWSLKTDAEASHEGSEFVALNK